ncbi:MAG TPA: type II toxin-antitoxin system VapC family toxin [Candidatus Limnocylindria bacterium]|nr:type II toxin-antitoxin system VapC family toxin [Candidatus Limnocylindria bacterium]
MTTLVLDNSVIVNWALADPRVEPDTDRALDLLERVQTGGVAIVEPSHWLAEVAAVLCRLVPRRAREIVRLLDAMQLPVSDHPVREGQALHRAIGGVKFTASTRRPRSSYGRSTGRALVSGGAGGLRLRDRPRALSASGGCLDAARRASQDARKECAWPAEVVKTL